jgi:SAM-dependent methyltransferase
LKEKIHKKVNSGQVLPEGPRGQKSFDKSTSIERNNLHNSLDVAERNAHIGSTLPPFNKSSFFKRKVYYLVTKLLFKVLKVITINQRNYNLSVLDTFRAVINDQNDLKLRFAETKIQFDTRTTEFIQKLGQKDMEINKLNSMVDYLKNSLGQLEQSISNISGVSGKSIRKTGKNKLRNLTNESSYNLDSLYVFLEDNLRGSHKEIKRRLKVYIPFIKKANVGSKDSPILDIGCGRGEWLELLRDERLQAKGLDLNKIMIKICKDRGLDVVQDEALSFLKNLPDHSLGAVTGFHLIEHYEFESLNKLLNETFRVLKPGGLAIFETPNPDNILVGSNTFYLDPCHKRPLPSLLTKLLMEANGFNDIIIKNLHPGKISLNDEKIEEETLQIFRKYFSGPQDYAVIGHKK